jgi:hypothetical protein
MSATLTRTAPPTRTAPLLRPVPVYDPPYDDEAPGGTSGPVPGQVPLALPTPPAPSLPAPVPPAPGASPASRTAAVRFVNACLEIFNGYRPVAHARALAGPLQAAPVLAALTLASRRLARVAGQPPAGKIKLRRMRVCEPRDGVAEISVVLTTGCQRPAAGRSWAAAFRLERHHGRWQCTAAHLL